MTNEGETAVTHLNASMNTPPSGTSLTGCSNQTLEPNASCTMTITPGTSSSSGCSSGTAPQPSVIQVNWDNSGSPLSIPVTVLDYGCLFQGGYVFALDDSPPANASIQGKVVAQNVQPSTMPWNPNNILFCGISDNSTPTSPYPTGANCTPAPSKTTPYCLGKNDGSCNTKIIQAAVTSPTPTPTALVCSQSKDGGFTDWYLPAICELSYALQGAGFDNICGSKLTPSTQNIYYLFHANLANLQAMPYWSSTQYQGDNSATWWANFGATVTPGPGIFFRQRSSSNGLVRCVRQFSLSP